VGILGCEFGAYAEFSLWRRIFIGSYSLPPSLVAQSVLQMQKEKPKEN
jgi:hypothetical protein